MDNGKYIAYYRVSTDQQSRSGLGLDAQRAAVENHLHGNRAHLVDEFIEVESGKKHHNRPQLLAALAACRKQQATLVIAKLDRLARNVHFIAGLMESGVEFVAADMPNANDFMLHIYAAVAQEERRLISQRTKAALAAAKARGVKLGNPTLMELNQRLREQADRFALSMVATVEALQEEGYGTLQALTDELNRRGIPTASSRGKWHIPTVHKLLKRIERLKTFKR